MLKYSHAAYDLGASASARKVASDALAALGGLDYLVNNAGAPGTRAPIPPADLAALTDEFWDRMLRMTRELARGLAPAVRVNGIAPGLVRSNWECSFGDLDALAQGSTALARVGEPEDYAQVIAFLCAGAAYITGEVIPVSGGMRL